MRYIPFNPKSLKGAQARWWMKWEARASQARDFLTATWKSDRQNNPRQLPGVSFNQRVWADLKDWFLEHVFFGHCAYCESPITRCDPDAEHYRPKGMVTHQVEQQTLVAPAMDEDGVLGKHPGYFWLAYDWRNLLPSCHYCNRPNNHSKGKRNHFPVSKKHLFVISSRSRYVKGGIPLTNKKVLPTTQALDQLEKPLLLNPFKDDPSLYLKFIRGGHVVGKGAKGQATIKALYLDEPRLERQRHEAQLRCMTDYLLHKISDLQSGSSDRGHMLDPYLEGKKPFSSACLQFLTNEEQLSVQGLLAKTSGKPKANT